jgi:predicted dehydrogenase
VTAVDAVRIGTLGAARIAPAALVRPARAVPDAELVAVAARDPQRAEVFARKHGIPKVHRTYDDLVADPEIDAVYNPLPNGLHAEWTMKALAAGKHVLCEKPFTSNAAEAEEVAAAAAGTDLVLMEAFHYRYHPLAQRLHELASGGGLGRLRHLEAWACIPLPKFSDIRWQYDLAGGSLMDIGCYGVHQLRTAGGPEPEVVKARAKLHSPKVDRWIRAELRWPEGHTGRLTCAMWSSTLFKLAIRVTGDDGEVRVFNPTGPQFYHRFTVIRDGVKQRERFPRKATYTYQLEAFIAAVRTGAPTLTPPSDSIQNMRVIDAIYTAAGLPLRGAPSP